MPRAATDNTRPDAATQFKTRGYVLSENAEMVLKDLFAAMEATAFAYDMDQGGTANFDLSGDQVAAVLRSYSYARLGKQVLSGTPFANEAMAHKRDD
ncbi:hypothetical protein SAMN05518801_10755 [Novosphingobium sp. CF614]|uniref:hypothetical protein n=1 Tax=Novosphingobium sp. CF614 TaxID=1884364 RepID=UPI0008EA1117|nr:hypothetical protein [Novosphingobium sp. CF614]SFG08786.1 hypothetical protein SAMN05518801_10755 [Novosphingobium sp. CF614]